MFLGNTLGSAASGLDSIERQIAVVSQNVANASTPNYVRESVPLSSVDASAGPEGVRTGPTQRQIDIALQSHVLVSVGQEAGSNVTQSALSAIDQASGTPGSGQDVASLLGSLRDSFSTLSTDPSSQSQQYDVLNKAGSLVDGLHSLTGTIVNERQTAQDTIVSDVGKVNSALALVGTLSTGIIAARSAGQSTANLEDQRDGAAKTLAQLVGAKFLPQSNGDLLVLAGNTLLPTRGDAAPLSIGSANFSASTPTSIDPSLLLDGRPISSFGGEIGANLTLRNTTLPAAQAQVDGLAQSLASGFQLQGLTLFTDPAGNVPPAGTVGFSATIQVSAAVDATPTILRDGTATPSQAGNTTLINNVLNNVFSGDPGSVSAQASTLVADFAGAATQATATASTNTSLRTGLESRLSVVTGVSVDSELAQLIQLQAAYGANAKVITATQTVWTELLDAVR